MNPTFLIRFILLTVARSRSLTSFVRFCRNKPIEPKPPSSRGTWPAAPMARAGDASSRGRGHRVTHHPDGQLGSAGDPIEELSVRRYADVDGVVRGGSGLRSAHENSNSLRPR